MKGFRRISIDKYKKRWNVAAKDNKKWLLGFYIPEFKSRDEIDYLELHKGAELFLLLQGEITLVIKETANSKLQEIKLKRNEPVIISCWHNGYNACNSKSVALVIERDPNPTKIIKIKKM